MGQDWTQAANPERTMAPAKFMARRFVPMVVMTMLYVGLDMGLRYRNQCPACKVRIIVILRFLLGMGGGVQLY